MADPQVVSIVLSKQLYVQMPEEFKTLLLHRLIALLESHPESVGTLFSVHLIYEYAHDDEKARAFLDRSFHTIVDKVVSVKLPHDLQRELPWTVPFEWPELKAAIFRLRPDIEEKYHRDQARKAAQFAGWNKARRSTRFKRKVCIKKQPPGANLKRCTNALAMAIRRLPTNYIAKATKKIGVFQIGRWQLTSWGNSMINMAFLGELAYLARWPCDMWKDDFSPVRSEAGHALFEIGTVQAWETLIAVCFANPSPTLNSLLSYWLELLTDKLSSVGPKPTQFYHGIEAYQIHWFKALLKEKTT